ncbi:hypothetical protein KJ359_001038 [Pestalotiopsis sp. 9143b]|nr:hypothetical protein KJ359_001038 [Pestalotiopsis sp. 9143b]
MQRSFQHRVKAFSPTTDHFPHPRLRLPQVCILLRSNQQASTLKSQLRMNTDNWATALPGHLVAACGSSSGTPGMVLNCMTDPSSETVPTAFH